MDLHFKKVLVLGDSIMNGSGNDNFGVGEYLKRDYKITLYKYCIGGARVGCVDGKSWIVDQVKLAILDKVDTDLIVFNGFTNDCCMNQNGECDVPIGELKEEMQIQDIFSLNKKNTNFSTCFESILLALKTHFPNSKYLFLRPHKMGKRDAVKQVEYGERAVKLCEKWQIAVCDIYKDSGIDTFLTTHRDKYTYDSYNAGFGDCTHPNALCYEEIYLPLIRSAISIL